MKQVSRIILLTSVLFQISTAAGQNKELDTVFVKRSVDKNKFVIDTLFIPGGRSCQQVLAGTMFLPYSDKIIGLLNKGLAPLSLDIIREQADEGKSMEASVSPEFISISRKGDVLIIDVEITANCCHNFLGEAEVTGKDTLNLVYTSYGGFCSYCRFTLRYKFDTGMEGEYQILKYVTINSSKLVGQIPDKK